MPDESQNEFAAPPLVAAWLDPVPAGNDENPGLCGPDLAYDLDMLELETLAAGKPETQFAAAEPPDWPAVREKAAALMERTRDLRIAMHWCRANIGIDGFAGVPSTLCLLQGLLDTFWDDLHPKPDPDDGDAFARISALGGLDKFDGLLGDVRQARLTDDRRLTGLRVRTVEIANDRLEARPDEEVMTLGQIQIALQESPQIADALRRQVAEAKHWAKRLVSVMDDRFGIGGGVDLKNLRTMVGAVESVLPAVDDASADAQAESSDDDGQGASTLSSAARRGGVSSIGNRADAIRALELVCAYLERNEPTSPAQLLLRRAIRVIDKNFLQLVRDLAPDALAEVARVMGVNPDEIDGT